MKKTFFPLIALLVALFIGVTSVHAATVVIKVSQFPNVSSPAGSDLFLLASATTNKNISWNQLKDAIGTNPATVTIVNNAYISNLFATNIYTSNLYATNITVNEFHGKTTFITNLFLVNANTNFYLFNTNIYNNNTYVSNYFYTNVINNAPVSNAFFTNFYITQNYQTNLTVTNYYQGNTFISNYFNTNVYNNSFVSNYYVTNLFTTVSNVDVTVNQFTYNTYTNVSFMTVSNAYITNLFANYITTNYMVFSTNIYQGNTYVSNYFNTNVLNNNYVSNFFNTNVYITNFPTTYITVSNYVAPDVFVSNFFNTNIFVTDNFVSNYFVTNIFPTYTITSNFTYNVAAPLTNATLYGTTSFSPISGSVPGRISLLLGGAEAVSLVASNSSMTANTIFFRTNQWLGPTNAIDMNVEDQGYASFTACSLTGLLNRSNSVVQSVMLTLTNKSSTNWLLTLPAGLVIPERTNQVAVSNASQLMLSLRYHPTWGSNGVARQF